MNVRIVRRRLAIVAVAALAAVGASGALGRSTVDDVNVDVLLNNSFATETTARAFKLHFLMRSDAIQNVTLRFTLPDGLRFGATAPTAAQGCAGTSAVVCRVRLLSEDGFIVERLFWVVEAERPGTYDVTATVEGERPDPNLANNSDTLRFTVKTADGGGGSVGGTATMGPKAGSPVVASASVTADGVKVKPSKVSCEGTLSGKKAAGVGKAATGLATCRYPTPKSAKSKTLAGSMAITAKGKTIAKSFTAKLG